MRNPEEEQVAEFEGLAKEWRRLGWARLSGGSFIEEMAREVLA
jgi:hypothetical protein